MRIEIKVLFGPANEPVAEHVDDIVRCVSYMLLNRKFDDHGDVQAVGGIGGQSETVIVDGACGSPTPGGGGGGSVPLFFQVEGNNLKM